MFLEGILADTSERPWDVSLELKRDTWREYFWEHFDSYMPWKWMTSRELPGERGNGDQTLVHCNIICWWEEQFPSPRPEGGPVKWKENQGTVLSLRPNVEIHWKEMNDQPCKIQVLFQEAFIYIVDLYGQCFDSVMRESTTKMKLPSCSLVKLSHASVCNLSSILYFFMSYLAISANSDKSCGNTH